MAKEKGSMAYEVGRIAPVIRKLYRRGAVERALFHYIANLDRLTVDTKVEELESALSMTNLPYRRQDITSFLKELGKTDAGTYVVGRRGFPTRFEWDLAPNEIGRVAQGRIDSEVDSTSDESNGSAREAMNADVLEHKFNLRRDFTVILRLPSDLTDAEAIRLSDFVKTLPLAD